jgi:hypothetical protein
VLDPKARPTIFDVIDSVQALLDQQSLHPEWSILTPFLCVYICFLI